MLADHDADPVESPVRDRVQDLPAEAPTIVSISDIHGFIGDARSALLAVGEHPDFDPIVEADAALRLHWAGNDEYVLVFNGDLIDRGAHSEQVVGMVERLLDQAPPGHVRVTFGNHEMGVLTPDWFGWSNWYSAEQTDEERLGFIDQIAAGHVVAAYEGYRVTYAHAGRPTSYNATTLNDQFEDGAWDLADVIGTSDDYHVQGQLMEEYPAVFGVDGRTGRGPDAGIAWLDFEYMPEDAPPQVVGHTRHDEPVKRGQVICQNVIRNNRRQTGGEGVIVETAERLLALSRDENEDVETREFTLPEPQEPS